MMDFQTERLRRRCECGQPIFHTGAHIIPIRRPAWIRRMEQRGLPAVDRTAIVLTGPWGGGDAA